MKEGVSSIWLIGIIIVFILIFSAYIAVTISYTATFKIKNEAINIIEKHKGMTNKVSTTTMPSAIKTGATIHGNVGALQTINMYLLGKAYGAQGHCPDDGNTWAGVYDLAYESNSGFVDVVASDNKKYYYCFSKYSTEQTTAYESVYYKVRFFYKMEFPALSEFLSVKVDGMTDEIFAPQDKDEPWTTNGNLYTPASS